MNHQPIGLYIHVPFCAAKCPYCDFYSLTFSEQAADEYLDAIIRAIRQQPFGRLTPGCRIAVDTVYLGGGTPSVLGASRLLRILHEAANCFDVAADAEITLEANPGTVRREELTAFRRGGFNRISFGVQSMNNAELAALGRIHTADEARQAIEDAYSSGFCDISADVMLAIPGQTADSLRGTLDALVALSVNHLSAYLLKIEEDTLFEKQNAARLCPDEDGAALFYLCCAEELTRHGFCHYEISNFAKNGGKSCHNLKYWRCEQYLGLGPSAHSFMDGRRFYFPRELDRFCQTKTPWPMIVDDGGGGDFEEYAMLRLRLREGLDLVQCRRRFGVDADAIAAKAKGLEQQGLITISGGRIALTAQGWLLSNAVTAKLLF